MTKNFYSDYDEELLSLSEQIQDLTIRLEHLEQVTGHALTNVPQDGSTPLQGNKSDNLVDKL